MRNLLIFGIMSALAGCGGLAWDTRVAERQATRLAMIESVRIGDTTELQHVARWGNPLQKLREGGRVDYIYRRRMGDHARYVIVTFEHGVAIDVRSNDTVGCRASFAPRVTGYTADTADIVKPVGWCADPNDRYIPWGVWKRLVAEAQADMTGQPPETGRPGIPADIYVPAPGQVK